MVERHRGNGRNFERGRSREDGPGGPGGQGGFGGRSRDRGEGPQGGERGGFVPRGAYRGPRESFGGPRDEGGGPPPYRERRPTPPPPPADEEFEDVDADLAIAILQTSAQLTALVGAMGLPEGYAERREAIIESFEAIYAAVLDTVTGGEEDEEE